MDFQPFNRKQSQTELHNNDRDSCWQVVRYTALEQIVTDPLLHLTGHYIFDDVLININSVRRLMINPTSALVNGICTWWVYIIFWEFRTDNSELLQIIPEAITSIPAYKSSSHCCILKTLLNCDLKQVMGNDSCWCWPSPTASLNISTVLSYLKGRTVIGCFPLYTQIRLPENLFLLYGKNRPHQYFLYFWLLLGEIFHIHKLNLYCKWINRNVRILFITYFIMLYLMWHCYCSRENCEWDDNEWDSSSQQQLHCSRPETTQTAVAPSAQHSRAGHHGKVRPTYRQAVAL